LTFFDIAFAAKNVLGVWGIHKVDFQTMLFEDFKNGHPINASGLHRYAAHAFLN
jgi:hypothetical protein